MNKIWLVAKREFTTTIATRGFIIGALMMPLIMSLAFTVIPKLMNQKQPQVHGEIIVIDPTHSLVDRIKQQLDPRQLAIEQARKARDAAKQVSEKVGLAMPALRDEDITQFLGEVPDIKIEARDSLSDLDTSIEWLKGNSQGTIRLAVLSIQSNAVANSESDTQSGNIAKDLGGYEFYVSPKLDDRTQNTIQSAVYDAIVASRLGAANIDKGMIDQLTKLDRPTPKLVSASSDGTANANLNRVIPFVMIGFLIMGVMMGAGSLLATTVEEKLSRVLEVLLSAVSPFELMAGKILGQLAVSGVVIGVYVGLGMLALSSFAMLGLVDAHLLVYLFIFFVINYLLIGSFMGAVGAAVNDMRDAQSLLMPVNILLMLPWLLAAPISRNPDSVLSMVLSFVPPVSGFTMLLRLASSSPPPFWQVAISIALNICAVIAVIWFASKVFKMALLLQGKPPNLVTLIKWARAA